MSRTFFVVFIASLVAISMYAGAAEQQVINPGDTLNIVVLGEPDLSKQAVVDEDGLISLPLVKKVPVAGLTTTAAADAIAEGLSKYIKNPSVTVELTQRALKQVTAAGQVRNPGVYPVGRETRLMEVIGLAGGFTVDADTTKIMVTRRGASQAIICDMKSFMDGSMEAANVILKEGDVILVPSRIPDLGTVFVYGAVVRPGEPIQLREGMTISQVISAAGGLIAGQSDPERAMLKREGQDQPVTIDLAGALAGNPSADLTLQPGDTITIPALEQAGTYTIYGAVANSGEFPLKKNTTVAKAIATAGTIPRAQVSDIRLTRNDSSGNPLSMKIDLKKVSEGRGQDVQLKAGDVIFVPERRERNDVVRWVAIAVTLAGILLRN